MLSRPGSTSRSLRLSPGSTCCSPLVRSATSSLFVLYLVIALALSNLNVCSYHSDDFFRYSRSRGGSSQERWRQDSRLRLLGVPQRVVMPVGSGSESTLHISCMYFSGFPTMPKCFAYDRALFMPYLSESFCRQSHHLSCNLESFHSFVDGCPQ